MFKIVSSGDRKITTQWIYRVFNRESNSLDNYL